MSGAALGWATKQTAPGASAKALLILLGDYADELGWAWPSVGVMAERLQLGERQIKRLLRALTAAGLLHGYEVIDRYVGRQRASAYWFPVAGPPSAQDVATYELKVGGRVTPMSPSEGDAHVTGEGDTHDTPGVTPMTPLYPPLEPPGAYAPTAGARDGEPDEDRGEASADPDPEWTAFEAMERAFPAEGLAFSDRGEAWTAFRDQRASGVAAEDLVAAASGYGPLLAKLGRTRGPVSLQRFLREGRWRGCLGVTVQVADAPRSCAVPADVRAAVAEQAGTKLAWMVETVVDVAGWDAEERTIICTSGPRAKALWDLMQSKFEAMGVRVVSPVPSSIAAE